MDDDCLVLYIKGDLVCSIDNETIYHATISKNENSLKEIVKLYVFVCFFIVVVVNILIYLFIRLCNLCFLRSTLEKNSWSRHS